MYLGRNPLGKMLRDRPGTVVILSGRNRSKIRTIQECLNAGFHVLADKPWILSLDDLDNLRQALELADQKERVALDIMTERHEIATILQREFVQDPEVFGTIEPGDPSFSRAFSWKASTPSRRRWPGSRCTALRRSSTSNSKGKG